MSKKVYIFLADGFEDIEGLTVVDLMRRAGITITTVSIKNTKQITTAHGITMLTDTTFCEADFSDADMLVLPGGQPGLGDAVKSEEKVVIDGNITTSRGLGTAIDFALSLISQLLGQEKAEQIAESVVYK